MVKLCVIAICLCSLAAPGEYYSNVVQILNVPIDTNLLERINSADKATPDKAILAFTKACALGDLHGFVGCFTYECANTEFGITSGNSLTEGDVQGFQQFMNNGSATNKMIVAYACASSNELAQVEVSMRHTGNSRVVDEEMSMTLVLTNGQWKISAWEVDE